MPSRLSSLLVRDGLVGVKRMEKAFQRQVIYGGSLDTILLEMALVPEERLTQYLALASGLPPASRDEGSVINPAALGLVSRELAEQYRATPVAFEREALRILVCAPLELTELEDLADLLDRPLQPLITPEYRWNLVFASAYGLDPPARFTTLARSLDVDPEATPVGRAPSIIVDDHSPGALAIASVLGEPMAHPPAGASRLAPVAPDAETLKLHDDIARGRRHTIIGVVPNRAATDIAIARSGPDEITPPSGTFRRARRSSGQPTSSPTPVSHAATPPAGSGTLASALDEQRAAGSGAMPANVGERHATRGSVPVAASGPVPTAAASDRLPAAASGSSGSSPGALHPASGPIPTASVSASEPAGASSSTPVSTPVSTMVKATSGPIPTEALPASASSSAPSSTSGPIPRAGMRALGPAPRPTPIPTAGRDSPLPIVRAREILAAADDRDTVFLTLLRAARSRARWAGLLTVQGGAAIGRVALAEPGIDSEAINTVLIPLDTVSPFRTVVGNHQPHIGPMVSGDPSIDSMVLRMGGTMPPSALILPIVLRDRVVALVIAHRVNSDLKLVDVTELLPMANAASEAIGRLIVRHKSAGHRAPTDAPLAELDAETVDTKRLAREAASRDMLHDGPTRPGGAVSAPRFEQGIEMSMEAGEPRPIDDVLGDIERAPEIGAEDAMAEAIDRTTETLRALARRFPGKLRIERFAVTGRPLRAAQYGGLLELVTRLGASASDLLIDRMNAPQRDTRFYATVCTAELRPRQAVYALAERLFDDDFGVRASALEALTGYPLQELGHALLRARRAVHSTDPDVVAAASGALVALGDTDSIPDLIGVIERGDRGGDHARRALTALTAQDFGASERKWRKWYEAARRRHRIEWLIDGLAHKEDAIRENAINVLRRLTGEYFGYHHDLPRKERDAAAERWMAWWREAGNRRFIADSERLRPTTEVPLRRE